MGMASSDDEARIAEDYQVVREHQAENPGCARDRMSDEERAHHDHEVVREARRGRCRARDDRR